MAIFINDASKVIVQGMTGSEGTKHTRRMLASGTKVVGGVTPGKGGQSVDIDGHNLPVFNTVAEAMAATGANTSVVFVPPKFAKAAVIDAIDAKMPLVVVITEGIPVHDAAFFYTYAKEKAAHRSLGQTVQVSSAQENQMLESFLQISLVQVPSDLSLNLEPLPIR